MKIEGARLLLCLLLKKLDVLFSRSKVLVGKLVPGEALLIWLIVRGMFLLLFLFFCCSLQCFVCWSGLLSYLSCCRSRQIGWWVLLFLFLPWLVESKKACLVNARGTVKKKDASNEQRRNLWIRIESDWFGQGLVPLILSFCNELILMISRYLV